MPSLQEVDVLFVCTGNICRSPWAEALARHVDPSPTMSFSSAGTHAIDGNPATATGRAAAATLGVPMDGHRARPLTGEMVDAADVIFVMEHAHRDYVRALDPAANVHLLAADGSEVADPYGEDLASYEVVYATIRAALKVRLAELDNR